VNARLPIVALFIALAGGLAAVGMHAQPAQAPAQAPQRTTWTVLREDGRQALAVTRLNRFDYVSSADLTAQFGATVREDRAGGLVLTFRSQTIVLSLDQGLASVGGRIVNLSAPPVRQGTGWLVPLDVIDRVFATAPGDGPRIDVRRRSSLIVVGNVTVPAVTGRAEHQPTATRLVLTVAPAVPQTVTQDQGQLLVRFAADALDADLSGVSTSTLLAGTSITPPATIALNLGPAFASYRVTETPDGDDLHLTIDLLPAEMPPSEPTPTAPAAPTAPLQLEQTGLRTIVIDPGHGGTELGARGPSGTLEKDIALSVARQLRAAIESRLGLRVLMTRTGDETVALDARAALANNNKADLFISLHANASVRSSVTGAEVFYVSVGDYDAPGAEAAEPGAMLPVLGGGQRSVDLILWEMAQARHLNESARFASLVEEELRQRVPMSPRAIQQAPFRVLVGANMPAVLVEMGFITNPTEEKRLLTPEYQSQLVTTLLNAIIRFKASVDRVGSPSVQVGR
jgi:N-acetylmuramoyl-L-alanine amidase